MNCGHFGCVVLSHRKVILISLLLNPLCENTFQSMHAVYTEINTICFVLSAAGRDGRHNLTSLLVQPISASLAKLLLSAPAMGQGRPCVPMAMHSASGKPRARNSPAVLDFHKTASLLPHINTDLGFQITRRST